MRFFNILDEQVHLELTNFSDQSKEFKSEFLKVFLNSCHNLKLTHLIYYLESNPYSKDFEISKFIYGLTKLFIWVNSLNISNTESKQIVCNGCNGGCKGYVFYNPDDETHELFAFIFDTNNGKLDSITQCKSYIPPEDIFKLN